MVINLELRKAYRVVSHNPDYVLQSFDPRTTLYWFEPGGIKNEPCFIETNIPILATVPPDTRLYHDFTTKNGAAKRFMPLFKEEELVVIGKDMLEQPGFPTDVPLRELYSELSIRSRFKQFNGIIRHVLPSSVDSLKATEKLQKQAFAQLDPSRIVREGDIEDEFVSSFVAAYIMSPDSEGIYDFSERSLELVSDEALKVFGDKLWESLPTRRSK
jgi:hypothetical protein